MSSVFHSLAALFILLFMVASGWSDPQVTAPPGTSRFGISPCASGEIFKTQAGLTWDCAADAGAGTGAPTTSQYWLGASDGGLPNSKNLGGFTALVLNTAGTPSAYQGTTSPPANQCLVSINGSGVGSWSQISTAFLDFDPATQSELDAHVATTTAVHGIANTANLVLKDGSIAMDKLSLVDRDATPVANRQLGVTDGRLLAESTGAVEGRYISRNSVETTDAASIGNDSVALGTKTTGNYVGQLTAGTNITLSGCTPSEGPNCTINAAGSGTPVILDLADDGSNESAGLAEIATTGDTNAVFTHPSANKLLIDLSKDWPKADVADNLICGDCVALGTETTGNYVAQLTAGTNITLTNCTPGEGVNCTIAASGGGGTAASTTFAPTGSIAGTDVQAAVAEVALEAEQVNRKSLPGATVANGYVGASATGRVPWGSVGDMVQHANLAAPTSIVPTAPSMGIQSTGGALISSAATQIAAGSYPGQRLTTKGTSAGDTFQLNNGNGIRLCANSGSVVLGLNTDKVEWEWNSTLTVWEEMDCKGLDRIANVGRKITTANSEANAVEIGDGTTFTRLYTAAGKAITECVTGGAACDTEIIVQVGKLGKILSGADELVRITEATDTWEFLMGTLVLNNNVAFTLNAEQANKTVQLPRPLWRPAAGCQGSTAAPIWDLPASAAAVAACVTGTNTQKGVLDFVDASTTTAQITERLSSAWTGDIGVVLKWFSGTGSTNSVVWRVRASCVADGETDDPAWDADVLQIVDPGKGTANQMNDATGTLLAASHLSTCAAGELLHLEVGRLGADGSDTHAATARLIGVEFLVRDAW
jgi:hypothetical protein